MEHLHSKRAEYGPVDLWLIASDEGLVAAVFAGDQAEEEFIDQYGVAPDDTTNQYLEQAQKELQEYFDGQRQEFTVPLDWQLIRAPFQTSILQTLQKVPYGQTVSYQQLAKDSGQPEAVRAGATAVATNPLPVFLPCHRVIRSDGSIGEYLGGSDLKQELLALESV